MKRETINYSKTYFYLEGWINKKKKKMFGSSTLKLKQGKILNF